jgi:flagellar motility protein MotE (MotC chaperone)
LFFGKSADDPKGEAAIQLWADQKDEQSLSEIARKQARLKDLQQQLAAAYRRWEELDIPAE